MPETKQLDDLVPQSMYTRAAAAQEASYAIHLIPAEEPGYVPGDHEVWPIYQRVIIEALTAHPEALEAAVAAVKRTQEGLRGLRNRDLRPGQLPGA